MRARAEISVAIATIERPEALHRCLASILGGDTLPAEILIIDQGRVGETASASEDPHASSCRVTHIHQEERGLSASRNLAIALANCETIAVTDDDCVPDRSWVAIIDRVLNRAGAPAAMTGPVLPMPPDGDAIYASSSRTSPASTEFSGKALPWLVGTGGNFAAKREWLCGIGGFNQHLGAGSRGLAGEDVDVIYRLLSAGARVRYEAGATVHHGRKNRRDRLASCWGYGHGVGAFCGWWLGRGDPFAGVMLTSWLLQRTWGLAGAVRRRQPWERRQEVLRLRGTYRGLLYGLSVAASRRCSHASADGAIAG